MSRNTVHIEGNCGKAPALYTNSNGKTFAIFSIAVNKKTGTKDAQGKDVYRADWFTVKVWGRNVEAVEKYIQKGTAVAVDGILESWRDKNGKTNTMIVLNRFQLLARPNRNQQPADEQSKKRAKKAA